MSRKTQTEAPAPATAAPGIAPAYLRPDAAAARLSISTRYLALLTAQRRVASIKIGRKCVVYAVADLDKAMMAMRRAPVGQS